jgi:hypothetical protein
VYIGIGSHGVVGTSTGISGIVGSSTGISTYSSIGS